MSLAGEIKSKQSPLPEVSIIAALRANAVLAAAGAYVSAGIVDVRLARRVTLFCSYAAAAIGGRPGIIPLIAAANALPGAADDSWFPLAGWDGSITSGALAGALPAGQDFTATPNWGRLLHRAALYVPEPATVATDKLRTPFTFDVTNARWLQVLCAEDGVVGTPGSLAIDYSLAV
jgi:hypothetical protein